MNEIGRTNRETLDQEKTMDLRQMEKERHYRS